MTLSELVTKSTWIKETYLHSSIFHPVIVFISFYQCLLLISISRHWISSDLTGFQRSGWIFASTLKVCSGFLRTSCPPSIFKPNLRCALLPFQSSDLSSSNTNLHNKPFHWNSTVSTHHNISSAQQSKHPLCLDMVVQRQLISSPNRPKNLFLRIISLPLHLSILMSFPTLSFLNVTQICLPFLNPLENQTISIQKNPLI